MKKEMKAPTPIQDAIQDTIHEASLQEAFFWKHLADTLLDEKGINKKVFYSRIGPLHKAWGVETKMLIVYPDIRRKCEESTSRVKNNFRRILSEVSRV